MVSRLSGPSGYSLYPHNLKKPLFSGNDSSGQGFIVKTFTDEERHAVYDVIRELRGVCRDESGNLSPNARILTKAIAQFFLDHPPRNPKDKDVAFAKEFIKDRPICINDFDLGDTERFISVQLGHWKNHWAREHSIQNGRYPEGFIIPGTISREDRIRDMLMPYIPV